jgi:uncharacterized protein (TIGR02117 family)
MQRFLTPGKPLPSRYVARIYATYRTEANEEIWIPIKDYVKMRLHTAANRTRCGKILLASHINLKGIPLLEARDTKVMKFCLLIILLVVIPGCSNKPYIIKQTDISVLTSKEIYIVNHGWHTGFVVPAHTIQSQLPQLADRFNNTSYFEFGWGDKGFYQAEQITSGLTLQAVFWPTEAVIHVVALTERPDIYYFNSEMEVLCLEKKQYAILISFIEHSFYKDNNGYIISLKNGVYGNSQFYKGEGDYYLMNTCNKWTAKGLKSIGLDIQPTFKLTAGSVMSFLSEQNRELNKASCAR